MTERWLPITGYDGLYEVSDEGRVRNVRLGQIHRSFKRTTTEHRGVNLRYAGTRRTFQVHRLVLLAFVGPPPAGKPFACHNNGDPSDNRLSNLRWASPAENIIDSVTHGTHLHSRKTHCKNGHEFTKANTNAYLSEQGRPRRRCRACGRERMRRQNVPAALGVGT